MGTDQRRRPRRALSYPVQLVSPDGGQSFPCVFADVSESGARLMVEDAAAVPDRIVLMLAGDDGARRHCEVVWRETDRLGVRFLGTTGRLGA